MRFTLLLCLALAACADAPPPDAPAETSTPEASSLALTADGLGTLGATTPFAPDAVGAALGPDVVIEAHAVEMDGASRDALWALRDGLLLAEVFPAGGTVGRVDVTAEGVAGPGGAEVGQAFSDVGVARADCAVGTDEWAGLAVCEAGGVELVFAHGGDPAALPPADALADALLTRMVWRAR